MLELFSVSLSTNFTPNHLLFLCHFDLRVFILLVFLLFLVGLFSERVCPTEVSGSEKEIKGKEIGNWKIEAFEGLGGLFLLFHSFACVCVLV